MKLLLLFWTLQDIVLMLSLKLKTGKFNNNTLFNLLKSDRSKASPSQLLTNFKVLVVFLDFSGEWENVLEEKRNLSLSR